MSVNKLPPSFNAAGKSAIKIIDASLVSRLLTQLLFEGLIPDKI